MKIQIVTDYGELVEEITEFGNLGKSLAAISFVEEVQDALKRGKKMEEDFFSKNESLREASQVVQGWLPALQYDNGGIYYFRFGGGLTRDPKEGYCEPKEEATRIVRQKYEGRVETDKNVIVPVGSDGNPIVESLEVV